MKLFFATALFALLPCIALTAEVQHFRDGLYLTIPDQGSVRYLIDDLSPLTAESVQFKMKINHPRANDLMVMLLSPQGKYALLPLIPSTEDDSWSVDESSTNLLSDFIGENAFGRWEIQIFDQVKEFSGSVESIQLIINGNRPLATGATGDTVVVGESCSEKWSNLLANGNYQPNYQQATYQCDTQLRRTLLGMVDGQRSLTYERVRKLIFTSLDNVDGKVCSVYSEQCIKTRDIPSNEVMNCEHTWPQSQGAVGEARTDLHHLFPAISKENSDRSNLPFCEIVESRDVVTGKLGTSTAGFQCYEPPDRQKGDVARAMFYFALRYEKQIDQDQEDTLRKWNHLDPVSSSELQRNLSITSIQGKSNPFIDHPEFVDLIQNF